MRVVALEVRYADDDRPVVEVRWDQEWWPGEVCRSVYTGSGWLLQVTCTAPGMRRVCTVPARQVRVLGFDLHELGGQEVPRVDR